MLTRPLIEKERLIKSVIVAAVCISVHLVFTFFYSGPQPVISQSVVPTAGIFLSFILTVYFISKLFELLSLKRIQTAVSLFLYVFLLLWAVNSLGHVVFQTGMNQLLLFYYTFVLSGVKALLIFFFFKTGFSQQNDVIDKLKQYAASVNKLTLSIRMFVAFLLMFSAYYLMSVLFFPFIEPHYNENIILYSNAAFEMSPVVAMLLHAVVVLVVTLPVIACWNGTKNSLLFWLGFPLFLIVAVHWLIFYGGWSGGFRFPVFIHLTLTLYLQAIILLHALYVSDDQYDHVKSVRFYSSAE
ncbi:hypothetical protein SAMN05444126_1014 [Salisediminibacterium halotolerans]|uniref:Uncharacterized protein n=1 Tax=Salisediminibacterium halotolerans TaxID=517425 RepID=A0A1H9NWV9_9BACI|nr:hypothetical protein SAMN05444126_1014 [Salisediminibacterium haloalkalitolerans]